MVGRSKKKSYNIAILLGSVRADNFTTMGADLAIKSFTERSCTVKVFDPTGIEIPSLGQKMPQDDEDRLHKFISSADAVVMCTPEYNGTFSSTLKVLIEHLGWPSILVNKPVAIIGVAAGRIGAIKAVEHLRGVCSHCGAIVLPNSVSISRVQSVFDAKGSLNDPSIATLVSDLVSSVITFLDGRSHL